MKPYACMLFRNIPPWDRLASTFNVLTWLLMWPDEGEYASEDDESDPEE